MEEKQKKVIYKKWWFWLIIILLFFVIFSDSFKEGFEDGFKSGLEDNTVSKNDSILNYFIEEYDKTSSITQNDVDNYDVLQSWVGIYSPTNSSKSSYQFVGLKFYIGYENKLTLKILCRYYGNFDPYHTILHNPKNISLTEIDDILSKNENGDIILFGNTYKKIHD